MIILSKKSAISSSFCSVLITKADSSEPNLLFSALSTLISSNDFSVFSIELFSCFCKVSKSFWMIILSNSLAVSSSSFPLPLSDVPLSEMLLITEADVWYFSWGLVSKLSNVYSALSTLLFSISFFVSRLSWKIRTICCSALSSSLFSVLLYSIFLNHSESS